MSSERCLRTGKLTQPGYREDQEFDHVLLSCLLTVFNSGFKMLQTPSPSQEPLPPDSPDEITAGLDRISVMQKVTNVLFFIQTCLPSALFLLLSVGYINKFYNPLVIFLILNLIICLIVNLISISHAKSAAKIVTNIACEFPIYVNGVKTPKDLRNTNRIVILCSLFAVIDALLIIVALWWQIYDGSALLDSFIKSRVKVPGADSSNFILLMEEKLARWIIYETTIGIITALLLVVTTVMALAGNIKLFLALSDIKYNLSKLR